MKKTFEVTRTITSTLAIDVEIPDGDVEASLWGRMQRFSAKALDIAESIDWNKMIVNQDVAYTISKRPRASEYAS